MRIQSIFNDLLHVFLPQLCAACDASLLVHEKLICTSCCYHLPMTDFHKDPNNDTAKQLWGKLDFEVATSMLYLAKSSRVERLLHRLKYGNQPEIGGYFGKKYAEILMDQDFFNDMDYIIPIPIHPSKLRKRGYNQAAQFAQGLALRAHVAFTDKVLIRTKATVSQIKKSRTERYDNVDGVFALKSPGTIKGKHILLTDDVLTTGATICSAGNLLTQAGARVSVITIARA